MIEPRKVRDMTKMAMLESGEGDRELQIASGPLWAYIVLQCVKAVVFGTIAFLAMCMIWFLLKWDDLNIVFADADYMGFLGNVFKWYMLFLMVYLVICGVAAFFVYVRAYKRKKSYMKRLEHLENFYERRQQ